MEISDSVMLFARQAIIFKLFGSRDNQPANEMAGSGGE